MIILKKALPRRTFLRGLGAAVALPLLDSMIPALDATRALAAQPARRLGVVYVPNGLAMKSWTPATVGAASGPQMIMPGVQPGGMSNP